MTRPWTVSVEVESKGKRLDEWMQATMVARVITVCRDKFERAECLSGTYNLLWIHRKCNYIYAQKPASVAWNGACTPFQTTDAHGCRCSKFIQHAWKCPGCQTNLLQLIYSTRVLRSFTQSEGEASGTTNKMQLSTRVHVIAQ
jgi:hypothetical protein